MQATRPTVEVPGDNPYGIMARSGDCLGMSDDTAVWRFGFNRESEAGKAYGVCIPANGFLWVLADRTSGEVIENWVGWAINMPDAFKEVIDWEPVHES